MHLSYKTSRYKTKIYKSYFLAESYREGNKVWKKNICSLGRLSDLQAAQIRLICQTVTEPDKVFTSLEDIVTEQVRSFLDLAVANALWEQWDLSRAFHQVTATENLSTHLVAKILTINRCIAPCSHYSIPSWISKVAIEEVVGHSLKELNDDKIYRELDKINDNQENLENHLFRQTYMKDKASYDFVNYDLSSSYFVGMKCEISRYGRSKDHQSHRKQILLGLMVNSKGYPFKWDVYPGNTPEVETLINNVDVCRKRFHLSAITLVFDRGIVSDENFDYISDKELKYISALDKDQIEGIEGIDLSPFDGLKLNDFKEHLLKAQFTLYDDESLYFKDFGVMNNRRYILGFNPVLCENERKQRNEKIRAFDTFLTEKNQALANAKRSRKADPTYLSIMVELNRLKIKKYFHNPDLKEIQIQRTNKNGETVLLNSFHITIEKKNDILKKNEKLDGLCLFVSNHTESKDDIFIIPATTIIQAYREKCRIEDAFKHIKSFLDIRPFHVNTPAHVRAVYSICILAYFLNKNLAERRKTIENIDYLNSKNLYEPFKSCQYVTLRDNKSLRRKSETVELTEEQKLLLKELNIKIKFPQKNNVVHKNNPIYS